MTAIYNDNDRHACAWLRELVLAGHIEPGVVDGRSIHDIRPEELAGYEQVHLFAGIGVWSLALRLAGWPAGREVWTASCPCQPFSSAGRRKGTGDHRHLWPEAFRLVRERRPQCLIGEQVASKDGLAWLDALFADLEGAGYACGAVDTCAASFGAPHIRSRLYWCAVRLADLLGTRLEGLAGHGDHGDQPGRVGAGKARPVAEGGATGRPGPTNGLWRDADWVFCRDSKWRPVAPGTSPLAATGTVRGRVALLRGAGNSLNVAQAAEFVAAVLAVT